MDTSISQVSAETLAERRMPATSAASVASAARTEGQARAGFLGGPRGRSAMLGQSLTWLCGGALALNLLLVISILLLLIWNGAGYFWQRHLVQLDLQDGTRLLGEVWEEEKVAEVTGAEAAAAIDRIRMKVGNRDIGGLDFIWVERKDVAKATLPRQAVLLERLEWGNFHGVMQELRAGGKVIASGPEAVWEAFGPLHEEKERQREKVRELEKGAIGDVNYEIERLRLDLRRLEIENVTAAERERRAAEISAELAEREAEYQQLANRLFQEREKLLAETLVMATVNGETQEIPVGNVVRAVRPNDMGVVEKLGLYFGRIGEFIFADPRESNTEGGIFPAIFGTVIWSS
ncbi:MAG TPA: hypothetical protein VHN15_14195 [Thermoanaerobaculia bacterium]|nr:hypothetical protein [Thermoanaerobaculia bacterium]